MFSVVRILRFSYPKFDRCLFPDVIRDKFRIFVSSFFSHPAGKGNEIQVWQVAMNVGKNSKTHG